MEQHPVPQNVTTFQFRLIGDMTIKQFGYLVAGAVIGFICYKLPIPVFFSLPMAIGVFLLGFGMAFVPIEERPMDIWILSFIKSIYNPTLYTWQRQKNEQVSIPVQNNPINTVLPTQKTVPIPETKETVSAPPILTPPNTKQTEAAQPTTTEEMPHVHKQSTVEQFLAWLFPKPTSKNNTVTLPTQQENPPEPNINAADRQTDILTGVFAHRAKTEIAQSNTTNTAPAVTIKSDPFAHLQMPSITGNAPAPVQPQQQQSEQKPTNDVDQKHLRELGEKNANLETKLADLASKLQEKSGSEERIVELQKQLSDILSEKHQMETELTTLRTKLAQQPTAPAAQTQQAGTTEQPERRGPTVRIITPEGAIHAGLPKLTTFPNVVTGIIKDYDTNLLPGVLVTVRDKDDVPLRALKTNKLGQFAASTPLPNNTYFIEVEDPRGRFTFDRIQVTLNGTLVPAIEVVAKSQKQIEREKLEKQIFGNQQF